MQCECNNQHQFTHAELNATKMRIEQKANLFFTREENVKTTNDRAICPYKFTFSYVILI